ncbi:LexA family protein [Prosthecochloris sp.]|uniref:LexA family protein n=1 Tax=unclassified Prosthecochloris TaxID=2632826 RepID=UPI00223D78A6|nr:translesion error-prone DNA polymerase V autoproteolytic subunit [Prosthecochloris sp.]UZJ38898.1 translesion error-prone DNA polymerase V autoproteolytic subunit [Prosthecochloris sp. SCSIO W1103]UZJ40103.1 translesion error-prone DNA polymerase V autoproteolytic subunit [Prosthecochloris sp. SCSIO W1102]
MRLVKIHDSRSIDFYSADVGLELELPFALSEISAGFPSPADDHLELKLDLNKALIRHPSATFYGRVKGDSMIEAGIGEGDILVIDKSLDPKEGDIAVCFLDGEFTVKRIGKQDGGLCLMPANEKFKPILVTGDSDFLVWGVVTYVIHKTR